MHALLPHCQIVCNSTENSLLLLLLISVAYFPDSDTAMKILLASKEILQIY